MSNAESENLNQRSLSITKILNAPIDLVWQVWTSPEHISKWWGPDGFTNTIDIMEVKVGGKWKFTMHGPDGTDYRNEYIYREIVPFKKIIMDHITGPKFTTTVLFTQEGKQTRMEWTGVFKKGADLQRAIKVFRADEGLKQNINKLSIYLNNIDMNTTIFRENLAQKQLLVSRTFTGPLNLVWRAWTEPELLDRWWAPKPWKAVTKSMDFREGGFWLYCMQGPDGEQHWGRANYQKIMIEDFFDAEDAFCDEAGNVNAELPGTDWHVQFTETDGGTRVEVTTTFQSEEAMKQLIEMGVKEGSKMAHDNLDELLGELLSQIKQ